MNLASDRLQVVVYSAKPYDERFLQQANAGRHRFRFVDARLTPAAAPLAEAADVVCGFVNDVFDREVLTALSRMGVRLIALRCAGFNNVDLVAADELDLNVVRVPAYSPHAVAEHTLALILALNRKTHRAYLRVREGDFRLNGLLGFDLHGKTAGVIGTGAIGKCVVRILRGFGCQVLTYDVHQDPSCVAAGAQYVELDELFTTSDLITLHCPLTPDTFHLIDHGTIQSMKPGVMLINTGRGALTNAAAVIEGLKSSKIGALGLDVYEEEADLFFEDRSEQLLQDDVFARLLTFPNVLITGHQAFFTHEALSNIAATTLSSIDAFACGNPLQHRVSPSPS